MKTKAAILVELGRPLELLDLDIPALKPGQVLVQIVCSGVCHTQILEARGHRGADPFLPHALGHEGSGIVQEIGPGVTKVKPGDKVILSWIKGSGADVPGCVYQAQGKKVNAGAITTFQHLAVISENRLTLIPAALSMEDAALLGCALPTGLGSVFNTACARPGQSLAVFGAGGVGLSAILGGAVAGCCPLIAVDLLETKLQVARQLGATHTLRADQGDPVEAIAKLSPGGVDLAIEVTGLPAVMKQALLSVRMRGGTAVIVGNAKAGQLLELDPKQFNLGKRLLGTWGGDSDPDRDYPRYARLIAAGRINPTPMKTPGYTLDTINQALDDLEQGQAVRPMIAMK